MDQAGRLSPKLQTNFLKNLLGTISMRKHITIFFTVLLFAIPIILHAQTSVSGTVIDRQTRKPLADVTVAVSGTMINTATNESGNFTLTSSREIASITVTCIGYEPKKIPVTSPEKPLLIELSPSQTELPGIQVVGSNQLLRSQSVGILTRQDLERSSGLRLESSINTIPGVFMQSRTPWGGQRVTIRGYYPSTSGNSPNFNGLGYQVLLNNIPITDATGTTIMDNIDFSSLGKVEVIKGPTSSRYGSFIGGTLNLETVRPKPDQSSIEQQIVGGSYGLFRSNTTVQSAGDNSSILVNYGNQSYNSFRPHSASKKSYIRVNSNFQVGSNQSLSAYFAYSHSLEELAGEIDSPDFYSRVPVSNAAYLANDSHVKINSFILGVTDNYHINEHFDNRTTVFGSGHTSNQPFAHGVSNANQFNFGARTAFDYMTRINDVGINGTLGGMFQRSDISSDGVFIVPIPSHPQIPNDNKNFATNYYTFTEWSFSLPDQYTVTVGASLNKNVFGIRNMLKNGQVNDTTQLMKKSFKPVFAPRISVSKVFGNNVSVYASVSSGYTPPLLSSAIATNGTVDLGLKPERAVQYEIGTKGNLLNQRLSYQLALFDLENYDKLVSETSNSITYTTNAGKQRNKGVEVSLSYLAINNKDQVVSVLRPWISYAWSDFKYVDFKSDNNNSANTIDYSGNAVARVPRNTFNAGVDVETNVGLYLNGTYRFVDKVPVTFDNSTYIKSYDLLSLKLGYKQQLGDHFMLDVSAGGNNLLGSTYYTFLFIGPNITGLEQPQDGGSGDGYIIPGPYKASVYGNFTLKYIF